MTGRSLITGGRAKANPGFWPSRQIVHCSVCSCDPVTPRLSAVARTPAAWRSSPSPAAPRRASADLVAERCDAAIGPKFGEKRKCAGCAQNDVDDAKPTIKRGKLSRSFASVVLPDLRLVVQDHVQQRVTDFQFSIVFNIAQLAKLVHEKAHARSGRANHLREGLLAKLPDDRLSRGFFAEIRQKQKGPRQPFLA